MNDGAFALMLGACWVNGWGVEFYKAWTASWQAFYADNPRRAVEERRPP